MPISSTIGLGSSQGRFQDSDVRSPLNGLRDDALLAHALHCHLLAAYLVITRMRGAQSVRAMAQSWEVRDEHFHRPETELTHIRLHRTIYYSLDVGSRSLGAFSQHRRSECEESQASAASS